MKHAIYWWNLENLFDVENSAARPPWLQEHIKKELVGWDANVLGTKLNQLCSIIQKMNNGLGPDILGVCEIENENVVMLLMNKVGALTNRNYKIMHKNTGDARGIDIAIIFDTAKYQDDGHIFSVEVMKRNATRDLLQINLTTTNGKELIIIGNHWPSRLGGKYESEPYRIMVGEILSYWIKRIHEIKLKQSNIDNPSIIVMGDFNDNPFDRSIVDYLNASPNIEMVKSSKSNALYNLMFKFYNTGFGTHVFGNEIGYLDQFMVSKPFIVNSADNPFKIISNDIVKFPELVKGKYNTPIRFSRPSEAKSYNPAGYSDHLPIELIIDEKGI